MNTDSESSEFSPLSSPLTATPVAGLVSLLTVCRRRLSMRTENGFGGESELEDAASSLSLAKVPLALGC
jgi:hypothetical protein